MDPSYLLPQAPSDGTENDGLGPDWLIGQGGDGATYYMHIPTDFVTWQRPSEELLERLQADKSQSQSVTAQREPGVPFSPTSSTPMQAAPSIRSPSVDLPNSVSPDNATITAADLDSWALPPGWTKSFDLTTRRTYYIGSSNAEKSQNTDDVVDSTMHISTWEHPILVEAKHIAENTPLPAGWSAETDTDGAGM